MTNQRELIVKVSTEPVAASSAATIIAGAIVYAGNVTHLWTISTDEALALALGVVGIVNVVGAVFARRRVTPTVKALPHGTPHTPGA